MVRLTDKRGGYRDAAQVTRWESAYHYKQAFYLAPDPQWSHAFTNILEDFHCEPCEANNLQLYGSYQNDDELCLWIAYSTSDSFDPRGLARGSDFDPWPDISGNRTDLTMGADGYATNLPASLPETGSILLCRSDLAVSDLFGRWVDFELLVKPSSHDSGVIKMWVDGKPYFFDGPNSYRWNQDGPGAADSLPVNVFQWGLYMGSEQPMSGTPEAWEMFATPPLLELGDDIVYAP
jgi:hypothetical protein